MADNNKKLKNNKDNDKKFRDADPSAAYVMNADDLRADWSLNEKEEKLAENRYNIFIHNLMYILNKHGMTQADLCKLLGGSPLPPQITGYKEVGKNIPYRTMVRISVALGYSPEEMTSQLLDREEDSNQAHSRPKEECRKYVGTYSMSFFATEAKLGGNRRSIARAMADGVMSIFFGKTIDGIPSMEVLAFMNCTEEEQEKLLRTVREAERKGNTQLIERCYESVATVKDPQTREMPRLKCFYKGRMILTDRTVEISLKQVSDADVVHLMLHNRAANSSVGSEYKGGLATMMSTSRGREHMPCVQALALSKPGFSIAKEELATHLFLQPPEVDMKEEAEEIFNYMMKLFPNGDAESPMDKALDDMKVFLLEKMLEKTMTKVLQLNALGYYKVSTQMDSDLYTAVCR